MEKTSKLRILLWSVAGMILLPIVDYFLLGYAQMYINGDITKETVFTVLSYVIAAMSYLLPYVTFALVSAALLRYGPKASAPVLVMGYLSLLMPYLGGMGVRFLLTTTFRKLTRYYLSYTLLNYSLDALVLSAVIAIVLLTKKYCRKRNPLTLTLILVAVGLASVDLVREIALTVDFLYELKYEYYSTMTFNELVSVVTGYLMIALKAVAGFVLMRLTAVWCLPRIEE